MPEGITRGPGFFDPNCHFRLVRKLGENRVTSQLNCRKTKGKRITKKNYNIYQCELRKQPLEARHVANFYNVRAGEFRSLASTRKQSGTTTVLSPTFARSFTSKVLSASTRGPIISCSILLILRQDIRPCNSPLKQIVHHR